MKIRTKIFSIIMLISLILATMATAVGAEYSQADEVEIDKGMATPDTEGGAVAEESGDNGAENGEKVDTGSPSEPTTGDTEKEDTGTTENAFEKNIFDEIWGLIQEYSGEIFSFLALIGSLILAFLYKKGLTPLLQSALSAIGNAVTSIKESAERGEATSSAVSAALGERLAAAETLIAKMSESVERVSEGLAAKESEEGERASLRVVLAAQIDMLYEIFMTSALPQYKKDAVGERIAEMRRAIGVDEVGN